MTRPDAESQAVSRKKVLLRLLARAVAEGSGIAVSQDEVVLQGREFRRAFGLESEASLSAWLKGSGLSREGFEDLLADFVLIRRFEERYASEIEAELGAQGAIFSAHGWSTREPAA